MATNTTNVTYKVRPPQCHVLINCYMNVALLPIKLIKWQHNDGDEPSLSYLKLALPVRRQLLLDWA